MLSGHISRAVKNAASQAVHNEIVAFMRDSNNDNKQSQRNGQESYVVVVAAAHHSSTNSDWLLCCSVTKQAQNTTEAFPSCLSLAFC